MTNRAYMIMFYNDLDGDFGYDPGPQTYDTNLNKSVAKSIARHLNRTTPDFITYWVEPEPIRYW